MEHSSPPGTCGREEDSNLTGKSPTNTTSDHCPQSSLLSTHTSTGQGENVASHLGSSSQETLTADSLYGKHLKKLNHTFYRKRLTHIPQHCLGQQKRGESERLVPTSGGCGDAAVRCGSIERALGQKRDIRESKGILNKIWTLIKIYQYVFTICDKGTAL